MADSETEAEFKQGFMRRTKEARVARALKQWEIADALGPNYIRDVPEKDLYIPN